MPLPTHWRGALTSEAQHSEEEQSDPIWAFTQLRSLGFGLVTISHANLMGLIRIARPSPHPSNDTGDGFLPLFVTAFSRLPRYARVWDINQLGLGPSVQGV